MRNRIALLLGAVLMVTACSGEGDTTTTTPSTSTLPTVTSTTAAVTGTTGATTTTTATTPTSTTIQAIDVTVRAGGVTGPERFSFSIGDQVSVWVLSDTGDEIHVHGYDLRFEARAGVPTEIALTADVPGIFEVEMETSHLPLFELEVTP